MRCRSSVVALLRLQMCGRQSRHTKTFPSLLSTSCLLFIRSVNSSGMLFLLNHVDKVSFSQESFSLFPHYLFQ